MAEAKSYTKA